jgi:hypothetical protein
MNYKLANLRLVAGLNQTNQETKPRPMIGAAKLVEAQFIPWNLPRLVIDAGRQPTFHGMIFRDGLLYLCVHYAYTNTGWLQDFQTAYLIVNPLRGVQDEILFPDKLGVPGDLFEVAGDALFVEAGGRLFEFKFHGKDWAQIPVPMEGASQLVWLKDRLYVSRKDGLLTVQPDSKTVQQLVSSRREPPANAIDPLWTPQTQIYPQADGKLGALAEDRCFTFDPDTGHWNIRDMPLTGTNRRFSLGAAFKSPAGAQWLLTGPVAYRCLVGFWDDNLPAESLLMEPTHFFRGTRPGMEKRLQPVRWDWPENFSLESADLFAEGKQLWVLSPRKVWNGFGPSGDEPIQFSDDRQATLFYFEPEFRQPLTVAIRFGSNSQTPDPFQPALNDQMYIWKRMTEHLGNPQFWMKTPAGLVFGTTSSCGHWLIPAAVLESIFQTQRQKLRQNSPTSAPKPDGQQKP